MLGARLFVDLPARTIPRLIGVLLLVIVGLRHTSLGRRTMPATLLAPAGAGVGLISAVAGSAGPLGAAVFLSLRLPARAYVASEAVTAVLMHLSKSLTYGRYAAMGPGDLARGLALGGALVLGSWTGRKLIDRMPEKGLARLIETLLVISAAVLLLE